MSSELPDALLRLAVAAVNSAGADLVREATAIIGSIVPFDVGEIVLLGGEGRPRCPLGPLPGSLIADDLVDHVAAAREVVRLDRIQDAAPFPDTRAHLGGLDLRSLLAVPVDVPGIPLAVVALARRDGWAFAGVSVHTVTPLAAMAVLGVARVMGTQPPAPPPEGR